MPNLVEIHPVVWGAKSEQTRNRISQLLYVSVGASFHFFLAILCFYYLVEYDFASSLSLVLLRPRLDVRPGQALAVHSGEACRGNSNYFNCFLSILFFCGKGVTLVEPAPEVDVGPDPGLPPARQGGEGGVPRGGGEQGRRIELQSDTVSRKFREK